MLFFSVSIHLCNRLNQNEYKIIMVLIKTNLFFFFSSENPLPSFTRAKQILWIPSSNLQKYVDWSDCRAVCKRVNNSCLFFGSSLRTLRSIVKLAFIMKLELWKTIQDCPELWVSNIHTHTYIHIYIYIYIYIYIFISLCVVWSGVLCEMFIAVSINLITWVQIIYIYIYIYEEKLTTSNPNRK